MHIRWVVDSHALDLERSHSASDRYRVALPAKALRAKGHHVEIVRLGEPGSGSPDVVVLGKVFDGDGFKQKAAQMLAYKGTVVDVCDNHFGKPVLGDYWRQVVSEAKACVAGSQTMADVVKRHASSPVTVIGDPLGSPKGEPRVYRRGLFPKPLKIAWYGMINNVTAMERAAFAIMDSAPSVRIEFHLVTSKNSAVDKLCSVFNAEFKKASMTFHEWSEETQWRIVQDCDLVLIPADPQDALKAVKSANRLTDAIHAGRYVIAAPVPAYLPYAEFASITADIPKAVRDYIKAPDKAKLTRGQEKVEQDCSLDAIADKWLGVFAASRRAAKP